MDEKVKDRSWNREFQYLLDRKILSRDELAYLLGQIDSILARFLSEKEKKIEETEEERHRLSKLLIEARTRIRELQEGIEKIAKSEYMNSLIIKGKLASLLKERR